MSRSIPLRDFGRFPAHPLQSRSDWERVSKGFCQSLRSGLQKEKDRLFWRKTLQSLHSTFQFYFTITLYDAPSRIQKLTRLLMGIHSLRTWFANKYCFVAFNQRNVRSFPSWRDNTPHFSHIIYPP